MVKATLKKDNNLNLKLTCHKFRDLIIMVFNTCTTPEGYNFKGNNIRGDYSYFI